MNSPSSLKMSWSYTDWEGKEEDCGQGCSHLQAVLGAPWMNAAHTISAGLPSCPHYLILTPFLISPLAFL